MGTGAEGASVEGAMGTDEVDACPEGAMGVGEVGVCIEGAMGACTGRAGEEPGGRGTKPDGGCRRAGAPRVGTG